MPCRGRRRAARLIAKSLFIGQYPPLQNQALKGLGAGDGNARIWQILYLGSGGFRRGVGLGAAVADAGLGPVQYRRADPRRHPARLLLWRRWLSLSVGLGLEPPRQGPSERSGLRPRGQDQGKGRHPGRIAEQRRQRAADLGAGTEPGALGGIRCAVEADQHGARQRRPAGFFAVALEQINFPPLGVIVFRRVLTYVAAHRRNTADHSAYSAEP